MDFNKLLKKIQNTNRFKEFAVDSPKAIVKKRKRTFIIDSNNWIVIEQKRAMIDLDGTIHKYSKGWQNGEIYDEPFEGARDVIKWLKDNGYEIVIYTTRASKQNAEEMGGDHLQQIKAVESWLKQNNIYFDRITAEKIAASFYIDDKAICIKDGNWDVVLNVIKKRVKYNLV